MKKLLSAAATLLLAAACGAGTEVTTSGDGASAGAGQSLQSNDLAPTGKGAGTANKFAKSTSGGGTGNGISYHGGPVMLGTVNVYFIWYGNWANNTATTILPDFVSSLGGSPYWNINTTYYDGSNRKLSNAVAFMGSTTDAYSLGTALTDANIQTIVSSAISSGRLPKDPYAVYFVLGSADVNATSGFCTSYCGWHTHAAISGSDIKYSFVGNPDRCPSACTSGKASPNGNAGADGMVSVLAHELEEAATDPALNAWYDGRGYENGDKCAWTWGTTYTTANGGVANMKLGARDYLVQQNWVNAGGGRCALSY